MGRWDDVGPARGTSRCSMRPSTSLCSRRRLVTMRTAWSSDLVELRASAANRRLALYSNFGGSDHRAIAEVVLSRLKRASAGGEEDTCNKTRVSSAEVHSEPVCSWPPLNIV